MEAQFNTEPVILLLIWRLISFIFGAIRDHLYRKNVTCKKKTNDVSAICASPSRQV